MSNTKLTRLLESRIAWKPETRLSPRSSPPFSIADRIRGSFSSHVAPAAASGKPLVEVSNLSNRADSRLLADPAYRQRVARAYVEALQAYYGESPDDGSRAARKR